MITQVCLTLRRILYGRGGIVYWADTIGPKHVYTSLKKWYELYGNLFKPSTFLEERATKGMLLVRFYCCFSR